MLQMYEKHDKYLKYRLRYIGFPCDQFAGQEPGSNEQIEQFCRLKHGGPRRCNCRSG